MIAQNIFAILLFQWLVEYFFAQANHLNLEQQGRSSTTEAYIYRHRLITRSTSTAATSIHSSDFYGLSTSPSFMHYYQPSPTFVNAYVAVNQTENLCPRQKNVHRNCQRSCQGVNQNSQCRHQRICVCDHNCGFSCLPRCNSRWLTGISSMHAVVLF